MKVVKRVSGLFMILKGNELTLIKIKYRVENIYFNIHQVHLKLLNLCSVSLAKWPLIPK